MCSAGGIAGIVGNRCAYWALGNSRQSRITNASGTGSNVGVFLFFKKIVLFTRKK
jgi:hypothetical protein